MIKTIARFVVWLCVGLLLFVMLCNLWVVLATYDQVVSINDFNKDDNYQTALILGTSYHTTRGESNPFFTSRISTGVKVYEEKLAEGFILSGSATDYYNEPNAMAKSLKEAGIPEEILTYDTLGVRTLASIVRCKEAYNINRMIIITQKFHAYRALFISNYYGINAIAIHTEDVNSNGKPGVMMREFFARPLAVIDLYILNRRP